MLALIVKVTLAIAVLLFCTVAGGYARFTA